MGKMGRVVSTTHLANVGEERARIIDDILGDSKGCVKKSVLGKGCGKERLGVRCLCVVKMAKFRKDAITRLGRDISDEIMRRSSPGLF